MVGDFQININFSELAKHPELKEAVSSNFGDRLPQLLVAYEQGDTDAYDELYDYFMDSLMNDAEFVETLYGAGPYYDEFPISICKYGPLYYISALEFDLMGTYDSLEEAVSSAESEFYDYINRLKERKKEQERKQEK
ncbi:hypothetical protein SDC9_143984 [bioreactor metagenome]|uniref:Uncharacterized protein n=1 Tax=bioreactor metagenome TaxID=1076179 RepID=A0A645E5K7_9ZZZZ